MLRRYEIPLLIASIFLLILILRFLFFFTFEEKLIVGSDVEIEHTFLEQPKSNEFQQYFYIDDALVVLPLFPKYSYGDKLKLKGTVEKLSSRDGSDVTEKLIIRNPEVKSIESEELAVFKFIRQRIVLAYKSILPPREAGLLSGVVLGVEDGIDDGFKNELKRTGMLHVVVASGSNVVLVAGIIFGLISGLVKKRLGIIFTIAVIFFYALLTGFDPPIVRASIMASFGFTALLLGRQRVALMSLMFSGWLMLMISPRLVTDVGFQLSFSATFGIILFQKIILTVGRIVPNLLKEDFATTLAAQIGALPFLLFAFGEVSLLSIFINLILLWTVPIIMIFGLLSAVLGLSIPILASPFLYLIYPLLAFFSEVVRLSSNFYIPLTLDSIYAPITVIYYILVVYILMKRKEAK